LGCTVLFSTSIYHLKYLMGEQGIKDPSPHFKTHIDPALSWFMGGILCGVPYV